MESAVEIINNYCTPVPSIEYHELSTRGGGYFMVFNGEGCATIVYYTFTQKQWRKNYEEGKEMKKERKRGKKRGYGFELGAVGFLGCEE